MSLVNLQIAEINKNITILNNQIASLLEEKVISQTDNKSNSYEIISEP